MTISSKIEKYIEGASWIRRMFEQGAKLKAEHGKDNVFDFSLGNPMLEPPQAFDDALKAAVLEAPAGSHQYMPNTGFPQVRAKIASYLSEVHQKPLTENHVLMTVGAAGALNCTLKAILDDRDEVIVWAPYFPEYKFYIDNHGGKMVVVETTKDFDLDPGALEKAVNEKTRAVIINSPNNPTGKIYSKQTLDKIGAILGAAEKQFGREIYLLSDEPYRKILYGYPLTSLFSAHANAIMCTSHSKDLGLPGERIGYAAINPDCENSGKLFGAMAFTNRILGFVNAPALMQRVVAEVQDASIDPEIYRKKRDIFLKGLKDIGYDVVEPQGAFYLFPRSPIPDDVQFVNVLAKHLVLTVPGQGFSRGGHFRIAYCVGDETIVKSLPKFADAYKEATSG